MVWTGDPDRDDAFVWCCDFCRREALESLDPSTDRDALLKALPPAGEPASGLDADGVLYRAFRREPGLWPWAHAPYRIGSEATIMEPVMPRLRLRLQDGREVTFGVAARIVFAPYADLRSFLNALLKIQQLVAMDLKLIADKANEAATDAAPSTPWGGRLSGIPSLGVFALDVVVDLQGVDHSR